MNIFGALTEFFGEPSDASPCAGIFSFSASGSAISSVATEASAATKGMTDPSLELSPAESD